MRLVARTVHGIEHLVAAEVRDRRLGAVYRIAHREIHLTTSTPAAVLTGLSTADDVLLLAGLVDGVGHTRDGLRHLACGIDRLDPRRQLRERRRLGGPDPYAGIDVSASVVGRRTYSRYDVEDAIGERLGRALGLPYHSRRGGARPPEGTCAWRVTLDGPRATIALRVADRPAHRRAYKHRTVAGTLHPPVAAAMVRLAGIHCGQSVLDPCCGAGTLPIEASRAAPAARVLGTDREESALAAAATNAATRTWVRADAGDLPFATGRVDRILVNPPWGRQVPARGILATDPDMLWAQARRVLRDDGRLVALLHAPDRPALGAVPDRSGRSAPGLPGFVVVAAHPIRLAGALATLVVASPR